ncbi:MAG: lipoyl synthase [Candidatus Omnitrophota bacterium]|nr:lipoyl synthase [Candidatus Omnitrophota bacterium]
MNRLPSWFRQDLPNADTLRTKLAILELGLNTVCQEAICPNINACFAKKQAAFIILGEFCTRKCRFCNAGMVGIASPRQGGARNDEEDDEAERIVEAVKTLGLSYVVITSVTRDDLEDGGASQFVKVIELLRNTDKDIKVEVLIPDFQGNLQSLEEVVKACPFVLAHNLETVKRLYSEVRPEADYQRSLDLLKKAKELSGGLITKSSLMLGLGENEEEVITALEDLRASGCAMVTLGQYLAPSSAHYPVKEFISPERFKRYYNIGIELGFKKVLSEPKARSSYCAEELAGDSVLCMI